MSICQNNIIAYTNQETKEIGFLDVYYHIKSLINQKRNINIEIPKINYTDDLKVFDSMTVEKLESKIISMRKMLDNRHKFLSDKKNKLENIIIINDTELQFAEEQLKKINNILSNRHFSTLIKTIEGKIKLNKETEEDNIRYSFYKQLEEQAKYLKYFKIGSSQKLSNKKREMINNKQKTKIVMNGLKKEIIGNVKKELINTNIKNLEKVLDGWVDNESKRIINEIDTDFKRDYIKSKLNLKGKVKKALSDLLNIPITEVNVMMKDNDFRFKLFGNMNMDTVYNKLNIINRELNEYNIINEVFINQKNKQDKEHIIKIIANKGDKTKREFGFDPLLANLSSKINEVSVNKVKKIIKKESIIESLEKELINTYKKYLDKNIITEKDFELIKKIIKEEVISLETKKNINLIKSKVKIHFSRIVFKKYIDNDLYSLDNITDKLSKIFTLQSNISNFEMVFTNLIHYNNEDVFHTLKKSFNSIIHLLISLKEISNKPSSIKDSFQNILYKKLLKQTIVNIKEKGKKEIKENRKNKIVRDTINVMNLLLLLSYTSNDTEFINDLQNKIKEENNNLEFVTKNKNSWEWINKEEHRNVINLIERLSTYDDPEKEMNKGFSKHYQFIDIMSDFITEDYKSENNLNELRGISKQFKLDELKKLKKEFNIIYDFFIDMYKQDLIPYTIKNKSKDFSDSKREYFSRLLINLYLDYINQLTNISKTDNTVKLIKKYFNINTMYLNEESKFLKKIDIKEYKPEINYEINNKDDLLNDFMLNVEEEETTEEYQYNEDLDNNQDVIEEGLEDNVDYGDDEEDFDSDIEELF